MTDDIEVVGTPPSTLEPEMAIDPELREKEEQQVDDLVQRALLGGDPNIAFNYVRRVRQVGRAKAYGTARLIYKMWKHWPEFQKQGISDDWENVAPGLCGLSRDQCERYRDIYYELYVRDTVPDEVKSMIAGKTMRMQYMLVTHAREDDFEEEHWQKAADAVNERELRQLKKDVRGDGRTSSKTRTTMVEGRDGVVRGREGDGDLVIVARFRSSREDLEGDDYESRVRRTCIHRFRSVGVMQQ